MKRRDHLQGPRLIWMHNVKTDIKNIWCDRVVGDCELGDEVWRLINGGSFLDQSPLGVCV
jgi:hypothetical protein